MRSLIIALISILSTQIVIAQNYNPVNWDYSVEQISQDEYEIIFTAKIDKGWTVYSMYIDEGGPVPTSIWYETEGVVDNVGDAIESGSRKEGMDAIFEMKVIKFLDDKPYEIRQKVKVLDPSKKLTGYLTYMTCDDERCLPPTDVDFEIDFGDGKSYQEDTQSSKAALSEESPVSWSVDIKKKSTNQYDLIYTATIADGWNVYSQYIDEGGPVPTSIWYETEGVVKNKGEAIESGHRKEGIDPVFDMHVIKFYADEPYTITQTVEVIDPSQKLSAYLTYMVCNDEKCLPPTDVDFTVDFGAEKVLMAEEAHGAIGDVVATQVGNVIDQRRQDLYTSFKEPMAECGESVVEKDSLLLMFIFGFIGGLLALLTPCVFPMIPLTVSFFTKDTKKKGWVNALIYGLSIIVIYVSIGLFITMFFGAEALNRLSTNWIANSIFFVIFVFFAFSFFGFYEITLPSSWSNKSDKMADKGGLIGIFFMAFTLAIVSFSCTGPIIGTALVQAASNQIGPFIVMLGFSMALALPFGLFAAFPAWLNSLPRSGGWMNSVKAVLGFIELAFAFKFLSVADMTNHWGFLRYELFMVVWVLIALAMALYGFGFIRFPHHAPVNKLSPRRWMFSLGSVALAIYLATGFIYKPETNNYNALPLLSGIAPPSSYNYFLPESDIDADIKSQYPSFSKCANNIDCFKDYYEGLAYAKQNNLPILLDHTGYGCVNCRKTEELIWVDQEVKSMLDDDFVLISLYVDDDKKLEKTLVSKLRNKKIRNVGNKWADFQIVNFEQNSQPLYIMITPEEQVIANPRGYKEGIEGYRNYLECGLETYQSLSSN